MITRKDYKIIEARCTYDSNGNHDIEYVVIKYQGKLYMGQSHKSQHEALENAIKNITQQEKKDKLLELYKKECEIIQRYINGNYQPMGEHLDNIKQIKALEEELE